MTVGQTEPVGRMQQPGKGIARLAMNGSGIVVRGIEARTRFVMEKFLDGTNDVECVVLSKGSGGLRISAVSVAT